MKGRGKYKGEEEAEVGVKGGVMGKICKVSGRVKERKGGWREAG